MDKRLPTYFERLNSGKVFVSSASGKWKTFSEKEFDLICSNLDSLDHSSKQSLYSLGILQPENSRAIERLEGLRIRDSFKCYEQAFSYFIIVATLRCNQTCDYCQVSRKPEASPQKYDLNLFDSESIANLINSSPSESIKIEFQGGESTLNMGFIESLIEKLKTSSKRISYVITSNLVSLSESTLKTCLQNNIDLSISLDGPEDLHTENRKHTDKDYFHKIIKNIATARKVLGEDKINAVCTLSKRSLKRVNEIPLFYKKAGFHFLSLRHITEIGFARNNKSYSFEEWFEAYREGLKTIIDINKKGYFMIEGIADIYIQKLFGSRNNIFVDMHNPIAMGTNAIVINYDGQIYLSDESRMLAEEGDNSLSFDKNIRQGDLTCLDIATSSTVTEVIQNSQILSSPICSSCAYQSHCGNDLVHNYNTSGDFIGYKPFSFICQRTKSIIELILDLCEDEGTAKVFKSWIPKN